MPYGTAVNLQRMRRGMDRAAIANGEALRAGRACTACFAHQTQVVEVTPVAGTAMAQGQPVRRKPPFSVVVNLAAVIDVEPLPPVPGDDAEVGQAGGIRVHTRTQPHVVAAPQIDRAAGSDGERAADPPGIPFQRHRPGE